jgi:hypothetical protein
MLGVLFWVGLCRCTAHPSISASPGHIITPLPQALACQFVFVMVPTPYIEATLGECGDSSTGSGRGLICPAAACRIVPYVL